MAQETMTRKRMREIQRQPKQTERVVMRTYVLTKQGRVRFPDYVMTNAVEAGVRYAKAGGDVESGWWAELAPLTKAERTEARAFVAQQKAA